MSDIPLKQMDTNEGQKSLAFIKEVAKYYMDFLETDFHRRKNPKRKIQFRSKNNLNIGLDLYKYPSFNEIIWKIINKNFNKHNIIEIGKGKYNSNIPNKLLELIIFQSDKINQNLLDKILKEASLEIEKIVNLNKKDFNNAYNNSLEKISRIIKINLALPFINNLEQPLINLNLGDENSIYLMEEELALVLVSFLENKVSEILRFLISDKKINIFEELKTIFNLNDVKNAVTAFFENFKVTDLFTAIFEIDRNKNILDKQEFYLYFCDITFKKIKYPIFYIPFEIDMHKDSLTLEFDSKVLVNKKALEYILQEYNVDRERKGSLKNISERIIYLAHHKNDFINIIDNIINEIVNYFELSPNIDLNNPEQQYGKSVWIKISNSTYISIFDKSDESLVNDYEDILQKIDEQDSVIASTFNKLIEDFIHKNPEPLNPIIEDEWDRKEISDRLIFESPIPLNSEQLQILSAIRKNNCKYLTVEGPPGTGKSHTITAIIFDAILKNQAVLVLSDKKEALDVVENKITDTMNKVRIDKKFQNPILRLGKTGSTYSQILSNSSMNNIKTNYRAVKKEYGELKLNKDKRINSLREDLEAEILAYDDIDINEIYELYKLENYFEKREFIFDIDEVLEQADSEIELVEFRIIFLRLKNKLKPDNKHNFFNLLKIFNISFEHFKNIADFQHFILFLELLKNSVQKMKEIFGEKVSFLFNFEDLADKDFDLFNDFVLKYRKLKNSFFGYLFKGKQLAVINFEFKKSFPNAKYLEPHKDIIELETGFKILRHIKSQREEFTKVFNIDLDCIKTFHKLVNNDSIVPLIEEIIDLSDDVKYLNENLSKYCKTAEKANINLSNFPSLIDNEILKMNESDFYYLVRYISLKKKIKKDFLNIPELSYAIQIQALEDLITIQMTYIMDERVVNFYNYNKNDAITMREIIRKKHRFPRDLFRKLKEAFPCILSGIRDYAEYIPLEPEIFDLLIIDEASQVSIAQAFPALLRAKKVLILGDKKQFSNVKSAQARTDTNREYLNNLSKSFERNFSKDPTKLIKLNKFDIKTSILEFFEFITNFGIQLLKHFRGYKEIISYSNKYFYQDNLQVMKIRGKNVRDVLKFSFIEHDGRSELIHNTNKPEADFIISVLKKLKDSGKKLSVGIITPHTNQQKFLMEKINQCPDRDYFFEEMKLKIMTFDTCQGEERDIVFYSLVATEDHDRLWGVFIKDLNSVDIEEEGKIKAQRLNVGFSRAKECMHFILSKTLDKYTGSIGEALRHYNMVLEDAQKEKTVTEVDEKSLMEPEVLNWFYQTNFWKEKKEKIEFIPQFELGKYLKQLDKRYNHPDYVVDFLLVYMDDEQKEHKIIIEYDGFKEHFKNFEEVNAFNYDKYYSDKDIERKTILEGYGYKFLRINKFNIGKNPIATLDIRLEQLIKKRKVGNEFLRSIHSTFEGLQNGRMKECPKCKEVRALENFQDSSLITGIGRFCNICKRKPLESISKKEKISKLTLVKKGRVCSICGSKMVLRNGRYGKFYGCTRFPYCRNTQSI